MSVGVCVWESGCACAAVLYFMGHSKDAQTDALKCRKSHAIYTIFIYTTQIHELPLSLSLLPSLSFPLSLYEVMACYFCARQPNVRRLRALFG